MADRWGGRDSRSRATRLTVVLVILLAGCASSDGIETTVREIGEGAPVSIEVSGGRGRFTENPGPIDLSLEVTNLSDRDITVTHIMVRPDQQASAFTIDTIGKKVNELISDGEDYTFELQTWGRQTRPLRPEETSSIIVEVRVTLSNGDIWRGTYELPVQSARGF